MASSQLPEVGRLGRGRLASRSLLRTIGRRRLRDAIKVLLWSLARPRQLIDLAVGKWLARRAEVHRPGAAPHPEPAVLDHGAAAVWTGLPCVAVDPRVIVAIA